jgi:polyhydroxybutyrate depolymerase
VQSKTISALLAGGLIAALTACGSGSQGPSSDSAAPSRDDSPARAFSGAAPSSDLHLSAGSQGFVRTVDGRQVLYVVPDPAPTTPGPLMIVLDYLGGNPTFMADLILAGAHAAQGEVLAFPAHQGATWNNGVYGAEVFSDPQSDVTFLGDVIADATTSLPVDGTRISMTGYSEGGFMANLFACDKPELLNGFGMVAAAQISKTACESTTPLKMMLFAGTDDKDVPYNGFGTVDSAPATLSIWQTINGCSGTQVAITLPVVVDDGTSVIQHQIPGCNAILYEIVNGGHDWPDAEVTPSTTVEGKTTQNIDATQAQWNFFTGS